MTAPELPHPQAKAAHARHLLLQGRACVSTLATRQCVPRPTRRRPAQGRRRGDPMLAQGGPGPPPAAGHRARCSWRAPAPAPPEHTHCCCCTSSAYEVKSTNLRLRAEYLRRRRRVQHQRQLLIPLGRCLCIYAYIRGLSEVCQGFLRSM